MTVFYIDPDWTGTENGTQAEPYASWPALTTGNTYLGKGGTTANLSAIINLTSADITIGTYPEDLSLGKHTVNGAAVTDTSRIIRVAAEGDNANISNLIIDLGGHLVSGVTSNAGQATATIYNNDFIGGTGDATINNKAISWQGNSPFEISHNTVTGFNGGIWLSNNVITAYSSVHHNTIANVPHADAHTFASAMSILGPIDTNYNLHLHDNDLSGWLENAIDLVGASKVNFYNNNCWGNRYSPTNQSAILGGATNGAVTGSRIYNNYIHDVRHTDGGVTNWAINTRGGVDIETWGNLIVNCDGGIVTSSVSTTCSFQHEHIIDCDIGIDNQVGTNTASNCLITGTTGVNSILESAGTLTYDHCYYDKAVSGAVDGGDNISGDTPLLDSSYTPTVDSPLLGVGSKLVAAYSHYGSYQGDPFPAFDIDIGAVQSTLGPFHPVNL